MSGVKFIGRREELAELQRYERKGTASLIVVKGRRRIGKSTLVEEFARACSFYEFSGLAPSGKATKQSQLDEFANQMRLVFNISEIKAHDWTDLFLLLATKTAKGKVVVFLDEISWIGSKDPDFLGKLKNAWDLYFKRNPELILIICGSASAWIEKNILSSTAFLGRISYTLTLEELPLNDCNKFFEGAGSKLSAYDKFKILSITGGVPRYLEEVQPRYSVEENIHNLCFKKGGLFTHEFKDIFSDLFGPRSEKYKQIVRLLVYENLEYAAICERLNVEKSGLISEYLNDLVTSGFVSKDYTWNLKTGIASPLLFNYRLKDNYLRFYLKYIENKLGEIERNLYQFRSINLLPGWATIMGLQFENLVMNNRRYIHKRLRLSPDDIVAENPFFQRSGSRQQGCQIDYMIQTRTNILYICEIKFSRNEIKKEIIKEVSTKIDRLVVPRGFSYCPVIIHVNGVSDSVIDSNYFTEIIDFSDILKME